MIGSGDYITRDAAIQALCGDCLANGNCGHTCKEVAVLQSIPAADVRPAVRADWKQIGKRQMRFACSKCNSLNEKPTCFCPNCGADMRPEPPEEGET